MTDPGPAEEADGMTTEKTVKAAAEDRRHGMTLDELAAFVQEAMREEIPGDATVTVIATWRSTIRKVEVTGK
ncbi:hypothetical protein [Actinomadura sp. NEAU-AAG7]|uniref:hypothetical protein n=1 Tax=Actinomadura sp. NEAU-AAG7 TaxID=2839640 RepID=UPI001BE46804|nr:hypothetical protein [Actinomadura sp. NEAU-AAG7]MBT2213512.1 hypothetical protein [Actinomadura sp. NEAU-AAG7]